MSPSTSPAQPPPDDALEQPEPPESTASPPRWLGLDRLGVLQVLGGIALGLIALFSSYDHVSIFGRTLQLQQQWGIVFIAASLATVVVDAQLATGSRLRTAQDAARVADEAARERNFAGRERNRAAEARERQAEAAASQRESLEDIRRAVFLSARVQLDPTGNNRTRLQAFLTLMAERPMGEEKAV
ncbi:MAG: hypothetical protein ACK5Q6_15960 [Cyanobacteriota bacterium]